MGQFGAVTGQRAFTGDTQAAVLAAILRDVRPSMSQRQPNVPRALERVVRKCMEKKPEDRWHSAADLKPALELIDPDAPPVSASSSSAPIAAPAPPRKSWIPRAAAVLGVLVIGAAAWEFRPSAAPAQEIRMQIPQPEGLTFIPGTQATISPDGKWLAFRPADPTKSSACTCARWIRWTYARWPVRRVSLGTRRRRSGPTTAVTSNTARSANC